MTLKETRETTELKQVTTGYKCDCCGKTTNETSLPSHWHQFNSHHHGWGNDSHESYEYFDVCSPVCYLKTVNKQLKSLETDSNWGAEIDGMTYKFIKGLVEYIEQNKS